MIRLHFNLSKLHCDTQREYKCKSVPKSERPQVSQCLVANRWLQLKKYIYTYLMFEIVVYNYKA